MKSWHWAAVVALAMVVGFGLGIVISPGPGAGGSPTAPDDARDDSSALPGVPTPNRQYLAPDGEHSSKAFQPTVAEKTGRPDDLEAILKAISVDTAVLGTGVITGVVTDVEGRPLEGVDIIPLVPRPRGITSFYEELEHARRHLWEDLVRDVTELARTRRKQLGGDLASTPGADGSYRVTGLEDREYYIVASKAGMRFEQTSGAGIRVKPGATVNIVGRPECIIYLEATTPDGAPLSEFDSQVRSAADTHMHPLQPLARGARHEYRVLPGTYFVYGNTLPPPIHARSRKMDIEASGSPYRVTLQLEPSKGVWIRINFSQGQPMRELSTRVIAVEPGANLEALTRERSREPASTGRRQDGSFLRPAPRQGSCCAVVYIGERPIRQKLFDYQGGQVALDFTLAPPTAAESIVCRLHNKIGGDLKYVNFRLAHAGDGSRYTRLDGWRLDSGEFRLYPPEGETQIQPRAIVAEDSKLGEAEASINHVGPQEVEIVFGPRAAVELDVGDWKVPQGASLEAEIRRDDGVVLGRLSASHGLRVLRDIPHGNHALFISLRAPMYGVPLAREPINVSGKSVTHRLTLPSLHRLVVKTGAEHHTSFTLESDLPAGRFKANLWASKQRDADLEMLPPGTYVLKYRIHAGGEKEQAVSIPGTSEISLIE